MKRNWMTMLAVAGGLSFAAFGQQPGNYPYDNGQYPADQGDGTYYGDPAYNDAPGVYAPAPPPIPTYAYQRPPMPGPGYYWVDGYWNFLGGRYSWVGGYWMLPPYTGGYWVAPRYSSGRFFAGFWGGSRGNFSRGFSRGFGRNDYRRPVRLPASRPSYRAPAQSGSAFRGSDNRGARSGNRGQHGGRR